MTRVCGEPPKTHPTPCPAPKPNLQGVGWVRPLVKSWPWFLRGVACRIVSSLNEHQRIWGFVRTLGSCCQHTRQVFLLPNCWGGWHYCWGRTEWTYGSLPLCCLGFLRDGRPLCLACQVKQFWNASIVLTQYNFFFHLTSTVPLLLYFCWLLTYLLNDMTAKVELSIPKFAKMA